MASPPAPIGRVSKPMKHIVAHIRQICCLGLGGEVIMPSVLKALHDLVGSDSNAFFWVNESGEITNMAAEKLLPPDVIKLYFREYFDYKIGGFRSILTHASASKSGVTRANIDPSFYQTEYYNQIWREHLNAHHAMYAVVCEHGKPLGLLSLYRAAKDPPFSGDEERHLSSVVRYIAHGLTAKPSAAGAGPNTREYRETEHEGLVVVNSDGTIQFESRAGRRLVFLASYPQISRRTMGASGASDIPHEIVRLCENLRNVFRGRDSPPPVASIENCWGRFIFRAHWLESAQHEGELIAVTVQHQAPLALKVLDSIRPLQLPPRQEQAILFLVDGRSNAEMAELMNIKLDGVRYHVKEVFARLGVHSREELVLNYLT
jgi:DNA-binding CsgD family transcriptional regulator